MENKQFYIKVNGQKVPVSEEVYRAYVRPVNARKRAELRNNKCQVRGERSGLVRCREDCSECPYFIKGNKRRGSVLSLDGLIENGHEEAAHTDMERELIEHEENTQQVIALHNAIEQLTERQRKMVHMIFFEGKTQDELAAYYGVKKQAVSNAMQRIYATLKRKLEKNQKNKI